MTLKTLSAAALLCAGLVPAAAAADELRGSQITDAVAGKSFTCRTTQGNLIVDVVFGPVSADGTEFTVNSESNAVKQDDIIVIGADGVASGKEKKRNYRFRPGRGEEIKISFPTRGESTCTQK